MGLCKCPKRKVTNQFCYEHRVNVCQYCMVSNHPKCIVQSYLQWLQDSDYVPICILCKQDLESEECIRLVCFHVFHWDCLDQYARNLPATTAPAGYTCPVLSCREPIIPKPNLISPIADVLRERISSVNWARIGLGLPLLSNEERALKPEKSSKSTSAHEASNNNFMNVEKSKKDVVVFMNDGNSNFSRNDHPVHIPRRIAHTNDNLLNNSFGEVDDDVEKKYIRKTFLGFSWRKFSKIRHCSHLISMKLRRPFFLILLIIFIFLIISIFNRIMTTVQDSSGYLPSNDHMHINIEGGD